MKSKKTDPWHHPLERTLRIQRHPQEGQPHQNNDTATAAPTNTDNTPCQQWIFVEDLSDQEVNQLSAPRTPKDTPC